MIFPGFTGAVQQAIADGLRDVRSHQQRIDIKKISRRSDWTCLNFQREVKQ